MHLQSETPLNVTKDLNKNYWQTLQGTFTALMNTLNAVQPPSSNCVISRNQIGYICSFLTGKKRALQHLDCCRDAAMFNIVVFNVWTSLSLIEWFWQTFSWTKTHQFCFFSCMPRMLLIDGLSNRCGKLFTDGDPDSTDAVWKQKKI